MVTSFTSTLQSYCHLTDSCPSQRVPQQALQKVAEVAEEEEEGHVVGLGAEVALVVAVAVEAVTEVASEAAAEVGSEEVAGVGSAVDEADFSTYS